MERQVLLNCLLHNCYEMGCTDVDRLSPLCLSFQRTLLPEFYFMMQWVRVLGSLCG